MGSPITLYVDGYFNAVMKFLSVTQNIRIASEIWHSNVYPNGYVCISILHPPGDDPNGYELLESAGLRFMLLRANF